jgi:hypothetical protein
MSPPIPEKTTEERLLELEQQVESLNGKIDNVSETFSQYVENRLADIEQSARDERENRDRDRHNLEAEVREAERRMDEKINEQARRTYG